MISSDTNRKTQNVMCHHHNEDLKHFLLHCPSLEILRMNILFLQKPRMENENKIMGDLLFNIWWEAEAGLF